MSEVVDDELNKKDDNRQIAVIEVLTNFLDHYEPAAIKNLSNTLLSTKEIANSITQLTGVEVSCYDIYELMNKMNFKYETINGTEFVWLLNKVDR